MLLLLLLQDYVGIQGLSSLLILTPGLYQCQFQFGKNLMAITAGFSRLLPTRLFNSGRWLPSTNSKQVGTNIVVLFEYWPTREAQHWTTNHKLNPHPHWTLHEGINKSPSPARIRVDLRFKGDLRATTLAPWSLCKLGRMHKSLEPHRGNLHQVILNLS